MKIVAIEYTLIYKSVDIFVSGCKYRSVHCCNPELWDFDLGEEYSPKIIKRITNLIKDFPKLIENIFIMGGEPLDQDPAELFKMVKDLEQFNKSIWLFTRFSLDAVPEPLKKICSFIKTGEYLPALKGENYQYGVELATTNQNIWKKWLDY